MAPTNRWHPCFLPDDFQKLARRRQQESEATRSELSVRQAAEPVSDVDAEELSATERQGD